MKKLSQPPNVFKKYVDSIRHDANIERFGVASRKESIVCTD